MLVTWSGYNRPTPNKRGWHKKELIPQGLAKAHEGLIIFVGHDESY